MSSLTGKVKLLMMTAALGLTALGVGLAGEEPKPAPAPPTGVTLPAPVPVKPGLRHPPPAPSVRGGPIARALVMEASHLREQISATWFEAPKQTTNGTPKLFPGVLRKMAIRVVFPGEPIEPPPPESVTIVYTRGEQGKSASELRFANKRLTLALVTLLGPLDEVLENDLPHEMTHVVLAEHFGKALPRWADEGMACVAESRTAQARYDQRCRELLEAGQGLRLAALFNMTEYPKSRDSFTAQAHSVTRFLLDWPPVPKAELPPNAGYLRFLQFVQSGTKNGWDQAAKTIYGFDTVGMLEAEWIGWLKRPTSRLVPDQPRVPKPPRRLDESEHIPPVKLSTPEQPDRVGRITIEGNTVTKDQVILDALGFVPGKIFQYPKVADAQKNLERLGLFTHVGIDVLPRDSGNPYIDIRVRVKEKSEKGAR